MKCFKTIILDSTELDKQLSHQEALELAKTIYARIQTLMDFDPKYREVDSIITQSFWLEMAPHYIHFDLDVRILSEENNKLNYRDQFNGPITFFYNQDEFILAREIYYLQNYQTYHRNNITI